jgi:hypothetical protein
LENFVMFVDRCDDPHRQLATRLFGAEQGGRAPRHAIDFGHARLPEEHPEILALRLRAHQHRGQLTTFTVADLASPFDVHAQHLVCRSNERIVGYVRLIDVEGDPVRSQYVTWGGHHVPDWLWQSGFIEGGAAAIEPRYQRLGLFLFLMQHIVYVARHSGHRYLLGACADDLVRMYHAMGFSSLETQDIEPRPGWRFRSHLIVLDMERLIHAAPEGKWVGALALAAYSADAALRSPQGVTVLV